MSFKAFMVINPLVQMASYVFQGTPSFVLAKKLATLKLDFKKWNEAEFGNVSFKK